MFDRNGYKPDQAGRQHTPQQFATPLMAQTNHTAGGTMIAAAATATATAAIHSNSSVTPINRYSTPTATLQQSRTQTQTLPLTSPPTRSSAAAAAAAAPMIIARATSLSSSAPNITINLSSSTMKDIHHALQAILPICNIKIGVLAKMLTNATTTAAK